MKKSIGGFLINRLKPLKLKESVTRFLSRPTLKETKVIFWSLILSERAREKVYVQIKKSMLLKNRLLIFKLFFYLAASIICALESDPSSSLQEPMAI